MTGEKNKQTALRFLELFGAYDPAVLDLLDDGVRMIVGTERTGRCPLAGIKDKKAIWESIEGFKVIMPEGIRFDIKGIVGDEYRVAVEVESYAKLLNGNKYTDLYQNVYHFLFKMTEDGKIQHITEFCDTYYATLLFT